MKQLLFLWTFAFCVLANAQITKNQLKSVSIDSLLNGFSTYEKTNSTTAKEYLLALLETAANSTNKVPTHKIHFELAKIHSALRKKDSALYYINVAIKETENDVNALLNNLYCKGSIYYEFGNYTKAIECYTEVYEMSKRKNDLFTQANLDHDFALIKTQIGQHQAALQLVKKSLTFYESLERENSGNQHATAYLNSLMTISDIYTNLYIDTQKGNLKYLDSAHYYNNIAIEKSLQNNDDEGFLISLRLKGVIHHEEGNIEQSTTDLIKAEEVIQNVNLPGHLVILNLYRGKNYFVTGDYEKALSYFQKTETLIHTTETDFPDLQELYILMAKSYEQKNDSENTITYFNLFYQKDSLNDNLKQRNLEKLYKKYDIVTFKDKINSLENNLKENKYNYTIILGCMLFLVIGISIYYKQKQVRNKKYFQKIMTELELKKEKKASPKEIKISKENVLKILQGLDDFEKNELFLKKNCSLNYVANKTNTNSTYLSKVIQSHKQKKFIQYITDLRIDYALEKLQTTKKFRAYNIKSIAAELGYNSAESFSKDFKRRTKLYPSYYIKKLNETES
ncbi:DNA-binding transcriptional regulator SoxS [Kordia sp. SMS9]|uniref:tetratricopeptide repeat protein n=1 Tax=Kordia sp. SMS9 TaxID=2282170 RepID=UPI000E105D1D|nr:tetratricopeptide repeat protein [Kordia sp. SMS9]AXG68021.1 DNA-binding transcriptional regulator SoxS [Kordia sp. SMS9]